MALPEITKDDEMNSSKPERALDLDAEIADDA